MGNKLQQICTIPFVICLGLLLLNDFYLKFEYHNWLTGKLSDFCGLFIFPVFWSAIFFKTEANRIFLYCIMLYVVEEALFTALYKPFQPIFFLRKPGS